MNLVLWALTGGIVGWLAYSFLGLNESRGMATSVIIGALGGVVGGELLAPVFNTGAAVPEALSAATLLFAALAAAALLVIGNVVHKRWGV